MITSRGMKMVKTDINANNLAKALPEEVLMFLHERYDCIKVPEEVVSFDELNRIDQQMGFIANEHTYLNYLYNVADIQARQSKLLGQKEKHENDVCKKSIIKSYKDNLEALNKLLSRKITLYQMNRDDEQMENRVYSFQRRET